MNIDELKNAWDSQDVSRGAPWNLKVTIDPEMPSGQVDFVHPVTREVLARVVNVGTDQYAGKTLHVTRTATLDALATVEPVQPETNAQQAKPGTCETCRFWTAGRSGNWGICGNDELDASIDYAGYTPTMQTFSEFGCIYHEAREDTDHGCDQG